MQEHPSTSLHSAQGAVEQE